MSKYAQAGVSTSAREEQAGGEAGCDLTETFGRRSSGLAWSNSVPGLTPPVVTREDLVVVGSQDGSASSVRAYRLSDGGLAWTTPVPSLVKDLVVADQGNLYVLMGNTMLALDAQNASLRKTYINLPTSTEMILRGGVMYVVGPSELVAVEVESNGYDPLSSWPVRFGDNQRTSNLPAARVR